MCPVSAALIKHSAAATWEGKGLCGLRSLGNALEREIKSESQTATTEKGWWALTHAQFTFRHSTGLFAWRQCPTQPDGRHSATISQMWAQADLIWTIPQMTLDCAQLHQQEPKNKAYLDILLSKCATHYRSLKVTGFFCLYAYSTQWVCNSSHQEYLICALFRHSFSSAGGYILGQTASLLWRLRLEKYCTGICYFCHFW